VLGAADLSMTPDQELKRRANFYDALLERVRALPGVDAAGFATVVPGQGLLDGLDLQHRGASALGARQWSVCPKPLSRSEVLRRDGHSDFARTYI
jgi:hypothetical protein